MNRRGFLGLMSAAAAGAVLAPELAELLKPRPTIFLPPKFGWHPSMLGPGYMREAQQYDPSNDWMTYRYDAVGRNWENLETQAFVYTETQQPERASELIAAKFKRDGLIALRPHEAKQFRMALLPYFTPSRFV